MPCFICTSCSGEDYAVPGQNALVLETQDPKEFLGLFQRLRSNSGEAAALRRAGRWTARRSAWPEVVQRVLLPRVELSYDGGFPAVGATPLPVGRHRGPHEPPAAARSRFRPGWRRKPWELLGPQALKTGDRATSHGWLRDRLLRDRRRSENLPARSRRGELMRIEELMNRFPATCGFNDTLREAQHKMQGGNCEFLPVTAGRGSQYLVGVITDGDIRMAGQLGGRSLEKLRVKDAMSKKVYTCHLGESLAEAQASMQEAGIRRLPVVDDSGRLLGVLSLANVAHETERESEALSAQISAAHFGLVASRVHGPPRVGKPT